jgi:hypothetical protein
VKGASLWKALASPATIRLSWKGLQGKNTLSYHENLYITAVKSFIGLAPGGTIIAKSVEYKYQISQTLL